MVVRLKEKWGSEYDEWSRRELSDKRYVYLWADGIHANVRLEDTAQKRQCMLVVMGGCHRTIRGGVRREFAPSCDYWDIRWPNGR